MAKATASTVGLRLLLLLLPLLGEGEFCRGLVPAAAGAKLAPRGGVDAFENALLFAAGSGPRSYWPPGLHWEWGCVAGHLNLSEDCTVCFSRQPEPPEAQGVHSCTEGCVLWSQHLRR